MVKIQIDIEDEELAKVVLRQLPKFLDFCGATHQEEQASASAPDLAAYVGHQMLGSNKIH
ncbi:hypothetical protein [Aeromonas salmonicida]|uniref:hypothetical protein n=1 Tax=Aeromonas salmonicida TaxID=645 RepID=UPI0024A93B44|nr:hypothetical protein [Aeromonas salmonicida]WHF41892.1 hypothetical protein QJ050_03695 [Aeromonas salmonicida]